MELNKNMVTWEIAKHLHANSTGYARRLIVVLAYGAITLVRKNVAKVNDGEKSVFNIDVFKYCRDVLQDERYEAIVFNGMELSTWREHFTIRHVLRGCDEIEQMLDALLLPKICRGDDDAGELSTGI